SRSRVHLYIRFRGRHGQLVVLSLIQMRVGFPELVLTTTRLLVPLHHVVHVHRELLGNYPKHRANSINMHAGKSAADSSTITAEKSVHLLRSDLVLLLSQSVDKLLLLSLEAISLETKRIALDALTVGLLPLLFRGELDRRLGSSRRRNRRSYRSRRP